MARPSAPSDPAQRPPEPPPAAYHPAIVPVMVCAWDGRLLVLTTRGWRHREGVLAAAVPLTSAELGEVRHTHRRRG